ncbi:MAG: hypothetical protein ACK5KQ_01750 [Anaerorhabdus sp.]
MGRIQKFVLVFLLFMLILIAFGVVENIMAYYYTDDFGLNSTTLKFELNSKITTRKNKLIFDKIVYPATTKQIVSFDNDGKIVYVKEIFERVNEFDYNSSEVQYEISNKDFYEGAKIGVMHEQGAPVDFVELDKIKYEIVSMYIPKARDYDQFYFGINIGASKKLRQINYVEFETIRDRNVAYDYLTKVGIKDIEKTKAPLSFIVTQSFALMEETGFVLLMGAIIIIALAIIEYLRVIKNKINYEAKHGILKNFYRVNIYNVLEDILMHVSLMIICIPLFYFFFNPLEKSLFNMGSELIILVLTSTFIICVKYVFGYIFAKWGG